MKKTVSIIAVMLAAGCALTFSACGSNSQNKAALSSNWYANTAFKDIQPTIIEGNANFTDKEGAEKITYKVKFQAPAQGNATYSVNYDEDGTYTTEFYAKTFVVDKLTDPDFKDGYPSKAGFTAYYYKTKLVMPSVIYTLKGSNKTETFKNDTVETECYFLPVGEYLRPLYSRQYVKSTTPANLQATALEDGNAYKLIENEYETFYSYDGKSVKSFKQDMLAGDARKTTLKDDLDKCANSLFDTSSLDIVTRATRLSTNFSQVISLYSNESGVQNYTLSGSNTPLSANADKAAELKTAFENELYSNGLFKKTTDENGNPVGLNTVAVSVLYNGEKSGVSQTYWFAAIDNAANNTSRATLLKLSVPLAYNLGTLNYTLEKIESKLWNR